MAAKYSLKQSKKGKSSTELIASKEYLTSPW